MNENENGKEDEVEIVIDDVDAGKSADGGADVDVNAAAAIQPDDLKAQLAAAQKRADEAEAKRAETERLRADDAERHAKEVSQTRQSAVSAEMTAIDNALANVEHERADAKLEYSAAMAGGDYDAAAEAQAKLADIAIKAQRIKEGKAAIERRAEDARTQADPVEQWASKVSDKSAAWIRSHPDSVRTVDQQKKLEQAHYLALGNGHQADTEAYFDFLNKQLYPSKEEPRVDPMHEPAQTRQQSAPAAPVSREGSSSASNTSPTRVRLTAAQREIAAACGMTDAEYAKNLVQIEREKATTH